MFLLDTNHCSPIIDGDPKLIQRIADCPQASIAICTVIMGELVNMAARSDSQRVNFQRVRGFLEGVFIYPIDEETAEIYGNLKAAVFDRYAPKDRKQRRRTTIDSLGIGDNDLWIAATALQHDLTLITADRDFARLAPLSNLAIDTWL